MATKKTEDSSSNDDVDIFMEKLEHPHKNAINRLRNLIKGLNVKICEEIKWNAPSYKLEDHFATFKLHPPKNIQIVLHRGAKQKPLDKPFVLDDRHKILKWAAADRCVITLNSSEQVADLELEVCELISQWIKQL